MNGHPEHQRTRNNTPAVSLLQGMVYRILGYPDEGGLERCATYMGNSIKDCNRPVTKRKREPVGVTGDSKRNSGE